MKSRITIEVDYETMQPVIQILKENSDDVRDGLLTHFTQQFGGSSWCQIKWVTNEPTRIFIYPIKLEQFKEHAEAMLEQHRLNDEYLKSQIVQ